MQATRLDTQIPEMSERLRKCSAGCRRQAILAACEIGVKAAELADPRVSDALEVLRLSRATSSTLPRELERMSEAFDEQYFEISRNGEGEVSSYALRLFSRARAASALAIALSEPDDNLHEAVYEAIAAAGSAEKIRVAIEQVIQRKM